MRKGLILAAMLIAALPARATIALVQHTTKDAASAASTTLAYGSNPVANHLLITVVRGADTLTGITTTDTIGNTWTKGTFHAVATICSLQISWTVNSTTAADTVTITPNANSAMRVAIYEYSGTATSSPLDAENNTQTGTGTALASTSITPAAGNELVFGVGATGNNHAETWTAGANFTVEDTVGANLILATEDWIQATATATTAPLTASVSDTWLAAIAVFKAAGGAAAPAGTNKREKLEKIDSQRRR